MSEDRLEALEKEIGALKAIVSKQKDLLAKTGQQVLSLQVKNTKQQLDAIPPPPSLTPAIDTSDFATNEDLVQLVGELQGQLDILEEKSVLRGINVRQDNDDDLIVPLPNVDGDLPSSEVFTKTVAEFKAISDDTLIELCRFYQLLPQTAELEARIQAFVDGEISKEELDRKDDFHPPAHDYTQEQLNGYFKDLAEFLGVSHLKREVW